VSRFSLRDDRTLFLFIMRDEYVRGERLASVDERKTALRNAFASVGWECRQILADMDRASDFYFDSVSQIRMAKWATGRTALIGDAAACVSLMAGEGTGLGMVEAYVLAGELHECDGDHASAFARYQQRLMPFLARKQASARKFASSFAPKSSLGISFRNVVTGLMAIPFVADAVIGRDLRDDIHIPNYAF
jgi:2-polyprenyl-6-methoxyphenol hydroxylase-like FAD-dependent oxidoreductase